MKKQTLLNSQISALTALLGHTDTIVIGDAGLPVPAGVQRIDLALVRGIPSFEDVLGAVLSEMAVESYTIASEASPRFKTLCQDALAAAGNNPKVSLVSHEEFKKISAGAKAVIRTGECSPYYNIILQANVSF